jgi:hypothetical protein
LSTNKYNIGNIRVIDTEKPQSETLFLPVKIKQSIPSEAYNTFLMNLSNNGIKIYVPDKDEEKISALVNKITENNNEITIVAHSTSCTKAIQIANESKNIRNIVLIDPIEFESLEFQNKINNFRDKSIKRTISLSNELYENIPIRIEFKNKNDSNKKNNELVIINENENENENENGNENGNEKELDIDNILIIKSKLSDKWKYMPFIPPIGLYSLNTGNYNLQNTNITVKEFDNFGHFDIIDSPWSDILHNTVSSGNKDRNNFKIQNHQQLMARIVSGFAKKKNNKITNIVIRD